MTKAQGRTLLSHYTFLMHYADLLCVGVEEMRVSELLDSPITLLSSNRLLNSFGTTFNAVCVLCA